MAPDRPALLRQARRVLIPAALAAFAAVVGTRYLAGPQLALLDNIHWTISSLAAAWIAWIGVSADTSVGGLARRWFALGLTANAAGQVLWDVQGAMGPIHFPGPSDFLWLWLGPCFALGLIAAVRAHVPRRQMRTIALDVGALSVTVLALTLALYLPRGDHANLWPMSVLVANPVGLLTAASIGLVLVPSLRMRRDAGWMLLLAGLVGYGAAWIHWNSLALDGSLQHGTLFNATFSAAALVLGLGAMLWRVVETEDPTAERRYASALRLLPLLTVIGASLAVVVAWTLPNVPRVAQVSSGAGALLVAALALIRQSLLLTNLRDSEARYRAVVENQTDLIVRWKPDGTRTFVNDAYLECFGLTWEEATSSGFLPLVAEEDRGAVEEKVDRLCSGSIEAETDVHRAVLPDGSVAWQEWTDTVVRDHSGRVTELQSVGRDITQRVQAEEALRQQEQMISAIVESSSDWVWAIDLSGHHTYTNRAAEKILGYSESEIRELGLALVHPEDRPLVDAQWPEWVEQRSGWKNVVLRWRTKSGDYRYLESTAAPLLGPRGELLGFCGVDRDITEQRLLEARLRQSQKMEAIGQLAGGVAHDFNNILAVVQGNAELALMDAEGIAQEGRELLGEVVSAAKRAASLVRQLLLFSREQAMQPRDLDLNEAVTGLAKMLGRMLEEKVALQLDLHPHPLRTSADPAMLDQVLMNLVLNARDAMPGGGQLVVGTARKLVTQSEAKANPDASPGSYVVLSVTDSGEGIPAEILPRIFEPFYSSKEPGKGTGLGLATVFGIVMQHGGWITVESEVGSGARFEVVLPGLEAATTSEEAV